MKSTDSLNKIQVIVNNSDPAPTDTIRRFTSPYDSESCPVEVNTHAWLKNASGVNTGFVDAFYSFLDKIEDITAKSYDEDFIPCHECHFAAPRHADDCMAAAAGDFELMGKQHMLINGFKCQLGCDEYATEKKLGVLIDGFPVTLLVCEACAFGGVDE